MTAIGLDAAPATADLARVKARKDFLTRTQERWLDVLHEQGIATYEGEATLASRSVVRTSSLMSPARTAASSRASVFRSGAPASMA